MIDKLRDIEHAHDFGFHTKDARGQSIRRGDWFLMLQRIHMRVVGRVQGVGFRYSTAKAATGAGVGGWVRNCPDGSVEIMAVADRNVLESFVKWCRRGPINAKVTQLEILEQVEQKEPMATFEIR